MKLFNEIAGCISKIDTQEIAEERKSILQPLINFIQNKVDHHQVIRLNFICTHNSRRSHLSQVWAQALAFHFGVKNVFCYSGGTEATAVFPQIISSLSNGGFKISKIAEGKNPIYSIKYGDNEHPVIAFSKKHDDSFNPGSSFAAILTCTEADGACPFIAGTEQRIAIPFEDPKAFDNTPQQVEKYKERSLQIATELFYVFSQIKMENEA